MYPTILRSFFALLCALALCVSAQARPLDEVIDSGELTVFVYSDYAPYSWADGDEHKGIDVEIAKAFGKSLGVKINILMRGADENIDDDLRINIWKGDLIHRKVADVMLHVPVDKLVNARNDLAVITAPYFQEQMALVVDNDVLPTVETFGRFLNNPIGVELDTAGDFFLSSAFRGQLHNSVRRGRTFADATDLYVNGDVTALLASKAQAEWVATQAKDRQSRIVQPPMPGIVRNGWPIGIAIKHDSRDLGYALGDVLTEMINNGEMKALYMSYGVKYLEPDL